MRNYNNEIIPNFNNLIRDFESIKKKINDVPVYKFSDFYKETENKCLTKKSDIENKSRFNSRRSSRSKNQNEIKGVYIFYNGKGKPVYAGISRTILRRIKQHFLGVEHNQASLAFLIARTEYGLEYNGQRRHFPFDIHRKKIQSEMKNNWGIKIIPIDDNYLLYFCEIILSCELKTYWNTFETH